MPSATKPAQRLFVGLPVPAPVRLAIAQALPSFQDVIRYFIPEANWHLTLLFLGEIDISGRLPDCLEPMPQAYLPTVSITHLGRGLAPHHVWAWVSPSKGLQQLHQEVRQRFVSLRPAAKSAPAPAFVPHIHVANLRPHTSALLPDKALSATFVPREINIYRSEAGTSGSRKYTILGSIALSR